MRLFPTIVGVVATGSIAGITVLSLPGGHAAATQPASPTPPATAQPHTLTPRQAAVDSLLADLSLTPRALCAAGATASEIGGVVANADAFLQSYQVPLAAAETAGTGARPSRARADLCSSSRRRAAHWALDRDVTRKWTGRPTLRLARMFVIDVRVASGSALMMVVTAVAKSASRCCSAAATWARRLEMLAPFAPAVDAGRF